MKKILSSILVVCSTLLVLSGCNQDNQSSNTKLNAVASFETISINYDDTKWEYNDPQEVDILLLTELNSTVSNPEEVAMIAYYGDEELFVETIQEYKQMIEAEFEMYTGAETRFVETDIKNVGDREYLYIELYSEITEEVINELLQTEMITEEAIEELGGYEEILSWPSSTQILVGTIENNIGYVFSGVTYQEETREKLISALTCAIETLKVNN